MTTLNPPPDARSARYVQLDGLRAFALAALAWSHWMPAEYQVRLPWGPFGVQLFFVLSGF
jgi:peptidoglycan/LPS O-acetylase OafA/YrhL